MADSQPTTVVENWKPVVGFEGRYEVSDWGRVCSFVYGANQFSLARPAFIKKPVSRVGGYLEVTMRREGKCYIRVVHRLVLEAFVGPCPEGMEACHNDGDPTNNSLDNLRWDTRKSNHADKRKHGTTARGSANGQSKLKECQVVEIKKALIEERSLSSVAKQYGVHFTCIAAIKQGRKWRHVVS